MSDIVAGVLDVVRECGRSWVGVESAVRFYCGMHLYIGTHAQPLKLWGVDYDHNRLYLGSTLPPETRLGDLISLTPLQGKEN